MCWATAVKKHQGCSRQSTFRPCTPTMSLGKISVSDEMFWNVLPCICRSLCHQSFAPCKEISSLQDILINRGWFLNLFVHFFGGIAFGMNVFLCCHTDANFTMSILQVLLKGRLYITSMMISLHISVFQPWEWQFHFVQMITSCSMLSFHIVYHLDATWMMR